MTFNDLIATTAMLYCLKGSSFVDWSMLPVNKYRIVRSKWVGEECPPKTLGDPEDFILHSPHDEGCAAEMSDLWEIVPPFRGFATSFGDWNDESVELRGADVAGGDLFRIQLPGGYITACSESFRTWLETLKGVTKWLKFRSIRMTSQLKQAGDENDRDILGEFLKRFDDCS